MTAETYSPVPAIMRAYAESARAKMRMGGEEVAKGDGGARENRGDTR